MTVLMIKDCPPEKGVDFVGMVDDKENVPPPVNKPAA